MRRRLDIRFARKLRNVKQCCCAKPRLPEKRPTEQHKTNKLRKAAFRRIWQPDHQRGGVLDMKLVKCPRCELNYIQEGEKYCKVCMRELKGEQAQEDMELCSVCNAAPALPGKDVCLSCWKEMQHGATDDDDNEADHEAVDESSIELNSVSTMDEILPQVHEDIPEREYGEIENELSLESVIEDEQKEDDESETAEKDE
jgi:hypothetical protein